MSLNSVVEVGPLGDNVFYWIILHKWEIWKLQAFFSQCKHGLLSLGLMMTPILSGQFSIKYSESNMLLLIQMPIILEVFQMCTLQIYYFEKKIFILMHKIFSSMKIN